MIAPLHPSHPTEPTPIFDAWQLDHARAEARAIVRHGLRVHTGGRMPRKSATRLRILNDSPLLYAVCGGA